MRRIHVKVVLVLAIALQAVGLAIANHLGSPYIVTDAFMMGLSMGFIAARFRQRARLV